MTKSSTSFNKELLDYLVFIKGMYNWRGSLWLFSSVIVNRGNSCELKPKRKTFLSYVNGQIYIIFRKFRNVQTQNDILKFLLLLAKVGCYYCLAMVNIIISIFSLLVFLKQLIYLLIVFSHSFFFSFRKNVHLHHFFWSWKILITAKSF